MVYVYLAFTVYYVQNMRLVENVKNNYIFIKAFFEIVSKITDCI